MVESSETFGFLLQRNADDPLTTWLSKSTFSITDDDITGVPAVEGGVYRFYNALTSTHFYTSNAAERDAIMLTLEQFEYEGVSFMQPDPALGDVAPVFRFFNSLTGSNFFTQSAEERDAVVRTLPMFTYEGEAFDAYSALAASAVPVFRFWNSATGSHFYTVGETEKATVIGTLPQYTFEGVAYWADGLL